MSLYAQYKSISLTSKMFLGMLLGCAIGAVWGPGAAVLRPFGDIFLNLLLMAAVPLVFFNLLAGIGEISDASSLGRTGIKIIAFYLMTSFIAVVLGVVVCSFIQPGEGFIIQSVPVTQKLSAPPSLITALVDFIPKNILSAMSQGKMNQIVVFSILTGIALLKLPKDMQQRAVGMFGILRSLFLTLVHFIMGYGPIGVTALMASSVGQYGANLVGPFSKFIGGFYVAWALMISFYCLCLILFARMSPGEFLKKAYPVFITTVTTCSSQASIPVSLGVCENNLKLRKDVYGFTIPLGASINMDGLAVLMAFAMIFASQAIGHPLEGGLLVSSVISATLLSMGASGIPGGGVVLIMTLLRTFDLPVELGVILAGFYRVFDMGITTMNVTGDLVGTTIVSRQEQRRQEKIAAAGARA